MFSDSNMTLDHVEFYSNTACNGGGAWTAQSARVNDATFAYNKVLSGCNSGGLDVSANAWITDTLFLGNQTLFSSGGGLYSTAGTLDMNGGEFKDNSAGDQERDHHQLSVVFAGA